MLLSEGLLTVQARGSHRTFKAINCIALKNFLRTHYEGLRSIGNEKNSTFGSRSEQALETGNSKLVKIRSCPGFPVNSYEPIVCTLHGVKYVINPPEGPASLDAKDIAYKSLKIASELCVFTNDHIIVEEV